MTDNSPARRPTLLVLASTYPPSEPDGTPAFVRDLALEEATAFTVVVVVPRIPGASRREKDGQLVVERYAYFPRRWEDLAHGAIIENLRARPSRWLQVVPFFIAQFIATRGAIRRHSPDILHVHWIIPQGIVARFAAPRLPALVTTLGGDLYALRSAPMRAAKRSVLRWASGLSVMNAQMKSMAIDLGARPDRVMVMPMGADLSGVLDAAHEDRSGLLFVGRLVEKKGLSVLLDALRSMEEADRPHLTVVGDGPLRPALEAAAAGMAVDFVGQLGRRPLREAYRDAALAVFPSVLAGSGDQDGLPVALLEAMGSACPVVVSNLAGLNEVVEDGHSGVVVPSGDPAALAEAILALLRSPSRSAAYGLAARERALDYSVPAIGARYREALLDILTLPRRAGAVGG